jgi:hypothetical protein
VVESRSAVPCRESRFWRTEDERVMLERDMNTTFLVLRNSSAFLAEPGHPETK